jgi:1,4-dihydroxy-2-naphthoate octaprenyltransferase
MKTLVLFIRLSRPLFLAGGFLMYALGVGIASYLGKSIDWNAYILGQVWVTLLQLSTHYFNEYYNAPADQVNTNRTFLTGGSGALGPGKLTRRTAMMAGLVCLTLLASFTVIIISSVHPQPNAYVIMGMAFLGAFFYSTPPVKLESSGYGELTTTMLVAFMVPAYSFILQTGGLHRLLAMSSFPLAALMMAMLLAFELPDYPVDLKSGKRTLMVRLGWQTSMGLHNILILSAFLLLVLARLFGYPLFAMLAGLLPLQLALFQVWQMRSIANGAKPNWNLLTLAALALFGLSAYLIAYAFWVN